MKYRSRTEIVSQILEIANGRSGSNSCGITKTKIMYNAFLSYAQLKEYLTILTDNGLLSYDLDTRTFKTTEKGHRFVQVHNEVGNVMKEQPWAL